MSKGRGKGIVSDARSSGLTTESKLLRLLQDEKEWDINTFFSVQRLLELLEHLDAEDSASKPAVGSPKETQERDDEALLKDLQKWLGDHGSCSMSASQERDWQLSSVKTPPNTDSRGNRVLAINDIEEGKVIMSISRSVMLCAKFGNGPCPSIASLIDKFADNPTLQLSILVLYHKSIPNSFFGPYLRSLPSVYSVPAYWDLDVFKAFNGSFTMKRAVGSLVSSAILYLRARQTVRNANSKAFPSHFVSWNNFRWALAAVMTRQNNIPLPGKDFKYIPQGDPVVYPTLVPGWDLMNHEEGVSTSHFDVELDCLVHTAMKSFPKGTEVTMSYGSRPNDLLLVYSGFCIENNPNDSLDLEILIPRDDIARVRDLMIKSFSEEYFKSTGIVSSLKSDIEGNIMFSVNKRDHGIMPLMAYFISAVSVMTRNEAKLMMKINSKNTHTVEEFLKNIDDEIRENKNNDDVKKTNAFENFENPTEKKLKVRCVRYLFELMTNQKILLMGLLSAEVFRCREKNKESESEIRDIENLCLNNGFSVNIDRNLDNSHSDNEVVTTLKKSIATTDNMKDHGPDSMPPKGFSSMSENNRRNILCSCQWLLEGQISIINDCLVQLEGHLRKDLM